MVQMRQIGLRQKRKEENGGGGRRVNAGVAPLPATELEGPREDKGEQGDRRGTDNGNWGKGEEGDAPARLTKRCQAAK